MEQVVPSKVSWVRAWMAISVVHSTIILLWGRRVRKLVWAFIKDGAVCRRHTDIHPARGYTVILEWGHTVQQSWQSMKDTRGYTLHGSIA